MVEPIHTLHAVHKMIQCLGRDTALQARFSADPDDVFEEFGLSLEEVSALKECTIESLARIGVHPMLRMHWLMMSDPKVGEHLSVREYIFKAKSGVTNG